MVTEAQMQQIVERIVAGYQPDRIILFGSYAYGTPTEDSDVDLLVIKAADERTQLERIVDITMLFNRTGAPPMDVLVLNSREEAAARQNRFVVEYRALHDGRLLYGRA